jgi:hypothetical protein
MGLTAEEKATLKALTEKSKQPDGPPPSVRFSVDLGNTEAVKRAQKLGLIAPDDDDDDEGDKDDDAAPDESPKRKGFFGE